MNEKDYYEDPTLTDDFIRKRDEANKGKRPLQHILYDEEKYNLFLKKYEVRVSKAREPFLRMFQCKNIRKEYLYISGVLNGKFGSSLIDHPACFFYKTTGGYIFTTQPYKCSIDGYRGFVTFCQSLGLDAKISMSEAWHYPGSAPLIVVCEKNNMDTIFSQFNEN